MMPSHVVIQQRQELSKQAMLSIMKYLIAAGKSSSRESLMLMNKLKKEEFLAIDTATYKEIMAESNRMKQAGGLTSATSMASMGSMHYSQQQQPYGQQPGMAVGPSGGGYGMAAGGLHDPSAAMAGAGKAGGKAGKAGGGQAGGVPKPKAASKATTPKAKDLPPYIGCHVQRYWDGAGGQPGSWYSSVATDYNPATNQYTLTYNLGGEGETSELLNFDEALPGSFQISTTDRIDLRTLPNSKAVCESSVMGPLIPRSKAAGKKRKSDGEADGGSMMF